MKTNVFFILMYFSAQAFSADSSDICPKPLVLSSTIDWFPYIYKNSQGVSKGLDVTLLRDIFKELDCDLAINQYPERRSLLEFQNGHFDIWLGASKNESRLKKYLFSSIYRHEVNKFIYRENDQETSKISSLNDIMALNKSIAVNLVGWYGDALESAKANYNKFIYSDTVSKRIKMLMHDRVDIVIDDQIVLCKELVTLPSANLKIHPFVISEAPIHFMFNKQTVSERFIQEFNVVLNNMKKTGSLAQRYSNITDTCASF